MCEKAREVGNYAKASDHQAGMRANILIGGIARLKPVQGTLGTLTSESGPIKARKQLTWMAVHC